ncbi:hypothetical protein [Bradyrhizobium sp. WSM3983]|nr:hypothetical protein [Bradyrhizobium sp. WSM3983]
MLLVVDVAGKKRLEWPKHRARLQRQSSKTMSTFTPAIALR